MQERAGLREAWMQLLSHRGLAAPDGGPLYAYRFTRAEYEAIGGLLRVCGARGLADRDGSALFVAFAAEWFRRDRTGGHWDWIRPLAAVGIRYHSQDPSGDLTYPQVRAAVEAGLAAWGRRPPADHEWVLAVVREAGFPASATRMDPRLSTWLKRSVLAIERGFSAREAVALESWRASERMVRSLFDAAVALCAAIAGLRAAVRVSERASDPVSQLDACLPGWRATLPFDVEVRDVGALVEELLRVRVDRSSALWTTRRLVRRDGGWQARASLGLAGDIEHGRMPVGLRDRLAGLGRMRLVARGELVDYARPFAALERDCDDERDVWEVRPLVTNFERALPLNADLRIGALAGDHVVGEFTAYGGEALDGGVVVLEPTAGEDPLTAIEFTVLGAGSVRSRAPWLALAVAPEVLHQVRFEERVADLGGVTGSDSSVVAFRGEASLELNGVRRVWRTNSEEEPIGRLVLVGETLRGIREQVFLGFPRVWIEVEGVISAIAVSNLRWRPRGRGLWRELGEKVPIGCLDIGVAREGEVEEITSAAVVPPGLRLQGRILPRALKVEGHDSARIAARGGAGALPVATDAAGAVIDLAKLAPGEQLKIELNADARLDMTLDDPSASEVLVTPQDAIAPRRTRLTIGRLQGYRLLAAQGGRLRFELDPSAGAVSHFTRAVDGSVPLAAFDDEVRNLLGVADSLDVDVRLFWLGHADRAAEIGWYERVERRHDQVRPDAPVRRGAFALLRPQDGVLDDAPAANAPGAAAALGLGLGPGPWLVYATGGDGEVLRPRLTRDPSSRPEGPLAAAVAVALQADRRRAFDCLLQSPGGREPHLLRWFVDLLVLARRLSLPLTALDGATALCRTPAAAVHVLAACDSLEERAAVLALQRDLSFLWSTSALADWLEAFGARRDTAAERLRPFGIDPSEALRYVLSALAEIADLQGGADAHVRLTFLLEIHGRMPDSRVPLDVKMVRRLMRSASAMSPRKELRILAGELVGRHVDLTRRIDVDRPPRGLRLAGVVTDGAEIIVEVNPDFRDIAASPYVAAALAAGLADPDHALRRRCREAWLFDPDYFERATPIALALLAGGGGPHPRKPPND